MLRISACIALCLFSSGCEEEAAKEPNPVEKAIEVAAVNAEPEVKPVKTAEPAAMDANQQAQADVEANPLTKCCRALGQRGFMKRSPEYVAAATACGESMKKNETFAQAAPGIKKGLNKEAMPPECN